MFQASEPTSDIAAPHPVDFFVKKTNNFLFSNKIFRNAAAKRPKKVARGGARSAAECVSPGP
jgi:hypothetical protein